MPKSVGRWLSGVGEGVVRDGQHVVRAGQVCDGARSVICSSGLLGDSTRIRRVCGVSAFANASGSVWSDQGGRHAEARQQVQQHRRRAPVGGLLSDDVVTGGHQGQHGCGERGHPGRGDHGRLGVLQFGDDGGDLCVVRVAEAGVEVLAPRVDGGLREHLRVLGRERRRLVDGRCHGTAGMDFAIGVNGDGALARHGRPSVDRRC